MKTSERLLLHHWTGLAADQMMFNLWPSVDTHLNKCTLE